MTKSMFQFKACICVAFLSAFATSIFAQPLQTISLKKAQWSPVQQQQICTQAKNLCDNKAQWQISTAMQSKLWLLSGTDMALVGKTGQGLQVLQQWHVPVGDKKYTENQPYIFPKLFPMSETRFAIALIHVYSEMYSGGGANIERADFYELLDDGKTRQFITNYPFSFNRMVRACFSEEDFNQAKGRCHDEDGLTLDIRSLKPMLWQFRYAYDLAVSPVSDSGEKSYKCSRNLNIDLNHAPTQPNIPKQWNYAGQD